MICPLIRFIFFFLFAMHKETLNIPLKLMRRFRKDKQLWELFIFAVCIKCVKGSSGIHPDVMSVRRMMRCSHNKAKRMIERAESCPELFYYNKKKNYLVARSFTHGKLEKKHYRWRNSEFVAYSAYCYKFRYEPSETISHNGMSLFLRDRLILYSVNAKERKNDFLIVARNSTRSERSKALSVKRLSHIAGIHHTTVSRHIRKLEASDTLSVTRHDYVKVADFVSGQPLTNDPSLLKRKPFLRQGYLVVKDANEYRFGSACADVFTNVIFNHAKRHRRHYTKAELALAHYDN